MKIVQYTIDNLIYFILIVLYFIIKFTNLNFFVKSRTLRLLLCNKAFNLVWFPLSTDSYDCKCLECPLIIFTLGQGLF